VSDEAKDAARRLLAGPRTAFRLRPDVPRLLPHGAVFAGFHLGANGVCSARFVSPDGASLQCVLETIEPDYLAGLIEKA